MAMGVPCGETFLASSAMIDRGVVPAVRKWPQYFVIWDPTSTCNNKMLGVQVYTPVLTFLCQSSSAIFNQMCHSHVQYYSVLRVMRGVSMHATGILGMQEPRPEFTVNEYLQTE